MLNSKWDACLIRRFHRQSWRLSSPSESGWCSQDNKHYHMHTSPSSENRIVFPCFLKEIISTVSYTFPPIGRNGKTSLDLSLWCKTHSSSLRTSCPPWEQPPPCTSFIFKPEPVIHVQWSWQLLISIQRRTTEYLMMIHCILNHSSKIKWAWEKQMINPKSL